jgi:KDO2-lipid IV(A) lauroyltransferase
MSNARLCDLTRRQRGRFGAEMIERSTTARKIVGLLRSGKPVMLAADMDHVIDNSVFVPFFGVPACTLTSVSRLARPGHARAVPFVAQVLPNYREYKLTVFEPFEDFPSKKQVLNCPEQYYWVRRRFKHRSPGAAAVY